MSDHETSARSGIMRYTDRKDEVQARVMRGEITVQAGEVCGHSLADCASTASLVHWHSVDKHSASLSWLTRVSLVLPVEGLNSAQFGLIVWD